jgi:hypothetical protein
VAEDARLRQLSDRIEALVTELGGHADPRTRAEVDELVRLLVELYGTGLARICDILAGLDAGGADLLAALVDDDLVASLLVLHDLHPAGVDARVGEALDRARASLNGAASGAELTLIGLEAGVVRLRLAGPEGRGTAGTMLRRAAEAELASSVPGPDPGGPAPVPRAPASPAPGQRL